MIVTLRSAVPEDAVVVADVLCESRKAFLPFAPMAHAPEAVRSWVAQVLIPGGNVYVAVASGTVVGMLAISQSPGEGCVDQLYVKPGFTGHGIGGQLLALAHRVLLPPIRLYTFQANVGARRFYERQGYKAVAFSDGQANEERCPDVLYEWHRGSTAA